MKKSSKVYQRNEKRYRVSRDRGARRAEVTRRFKKILKERDKELARYDERHLGEGY